MTPVLSCRLKAWGREGTASPDEYGDGFALPFCISRDYSTSQMVDFADLTSRAGGPGDCSSFNEILISYLILSTMR